MSIFILPIVVAADFLIKAVVRQSPVGAVLFISPVMDIVHTENAGAAFSLLSDHPAIVSGLSLVLLMGLLLFTLFGNGESRPLLFLLIGGGLANVLDRIADGTVTDYLQLAFFPFPVFNLADALITISVILLVIHILRKESAS